MGRKYSIRDQEELHFVTFTIINWLDVFIRNIYKEKLIESLQYCQSQKGLQVSAYCIMTSHVHLILSVEKGGNLSDVIRDLKSYTSREIVKMIRENKQESRRELLLWLFERAGKKNKRNGKCQFWQQYNHPIALTTNTLTNQRLAYIHNNPVEAGFVENPEDWIWSSASQYSGKSSSFELLFIE